MGITRERGTLPALSGEGKAKPRVLVVTAAAAEKEAVLRGIGTTAGITVLEAGVGPAAAAARTAAALASGEYGVAVSAGIGGGFAGRAEVGSLVIADEIVAADLGAESPDGFLALDELGFGSARIPVPGPWPGRLAEAARAAGLPVVTGPILTVSTVTGTAATAAKLSNRIPGAAAEGMEGFGVATAARGFGIPALEIRAVSNPVGPRDRGAWRMKEALAALEAAGTILAEVLSS